MYAMEKFDDKEHNIAIEVSIVTAFDKFQDVLFHKKII